MSVKNIKERVARLATLVGSWTHVDSVPRIERDLALDELRKLYDALLDMGGNEAPKAEVNEPEEEAEPEHKAEAVAPVAQVSEPEPQHDPVADFDDALDIDALLGLAEESKPEEEVKPEPQPEPIVEPQPARGGGLFDIEDIPVRQKSSRKMITLYSAPTSPAAPAVEPKAEPKPTAPAPQPMPQPVPAPVEPQRIGDVLGSGRKVVGDVAAIESMPTPPMSKITDLRKAIGLNDKFLMLRDLFAGDEQQYNATIDALNSFNDLDECMIYIVENFAWNPDSEGAKLIVSLIERKLS